MPGHPSFSTSHCVLAQVVHLSLCTAHSVFDRTTKQERRCLRADCGRSRLQLRPPFARCHQVQVGSLRTNDHHQFSKNAEKVNKKGHMRFRRYMGANAQINRAINPGVRRKVCQLHSIRNSLLPHIDSSSRMEISQYLWPRIFDVFCRKSKEFSFPLLKA